MNVVNIDALTATEAKALLRKYWEKYSAGTLKTAELSRQLSAEKRQRAQEFEAHTRHLKALAKEMEAYQKQLVSNAALMKEAAAIITHLKNKKHATKAPKRATQAHPASSRRVSTVATHLL